MGGFIFAKIVNSKTLVKSDTLGTLADNVVTSFTLTGLKGKRLVISMRNATYAKFRISALHSTTFTARGGVPPIEIECQQVTDGANNYVATLEIPVIFDDMVIYIKNITGAGASTSPYILVWEVV